MTMVVKQQHSGTAMILKQQYKLRSSQGEFICSPRKQRWHNCQRANQQQYQLQGWQKKNNNNNNNGQMTAEM